MKNKHKLTNNLEIPPLQMQFNTSQIDTSDFIFKQNHQPHPLSLMLTA